jgi:hypothetical protein
MLDFIFLTDFTFSTLVHLRNNGKGNYFAFITTAGVIKVRMVRD